MKNLKWMLPIIVFVMCGITLSAQNPAIDKVYSVEQSDALIQDFFRMDGTDINYPTDNISAKFRSQFPGTADIEWETRNNLYFVEFEIGKTDYQALYDAQANLIMYKVDIPETSLPEAVKKSIKEQYPGMRIDDVDKIVSVAGVKYEIELEKGKQEIKVYFNEQGEKVN